MDEPEMIMVLTMKSGVQLRHRVVNYTVRSDSRTGKVTALEWETSNPSTQLKAVVMDEIAAVATENLTEITDS